MTRLFIIAMFILFSTGFAGNVPDDNRLPGPQSLTASAADRRIDLRWQPAEDAVLRGYHIYRAESAAGAYSRLNAAPHKLNLYSDFLGKNRQRYFYYVTTVNSAGRESVASDTVSAVTAPMTTEELLTSVQEATFRYFYDYGHPVSGLARERLGSGNTCASGGTGFGLMALMVGAERGFETRDSVAARVLKIVRFLQDNAIRYHGAWSHWINGASGETIPFSPQDDGGDLVETSYVVMGLLTVRQYFDGGNAVESEIRSRATQLWEEVEWDWYRRYANGTVLYWHWSPNFGWAMNLPIRGFNEAMIVYLLAVASPVHPVPPIVYHLGWARSGAYPYLNGGTFYGYRQWVGQDYGGPLFFTHYTFMGFDPRQKADYYANYFENNRNISRINRAYCIDNPQNFAGYDSLNWGLTASDDPWGYLAHAPYQNDNGTITPTAALSAMPYVPEESIATLNYFYYQLGSQLWGEFGFHDAYNLNTSPAWFADSYIAIDQGPIVAMIENYRTQLCWNMFMANPEIQPMLNDLGFVTGILPGKPGAAGEYRLEQNYPNPFNPETTISFVLERSGPVTLEVYNTLGQKAAVLLREKKMAAGPQQVTLDATDLPSGIFFYRLQSGDYTAVKRMLLLR